MVVLISGPIAVGKSSVAASLEKTHSAKRIRSSTYLRSLLPNGALASRASLQNLGDTLDLQTDFRWLVDNVAYPQIHELPNALWLVDAVRKHKQVAHFREAFPNSVVHVHLLASEETLRRRHQNRLNEQGYPGKSYEEEMAHPNETESRSLVAKADLTIDTDQVHPDRAAEIIARFKIGGDK